MPGKLPPLLPKRIRLTHSVKSMLSVSERKKKRLLMPLKPNWLLITVEEHQKGGFGNIIAGVIAAGKKYNAPLLLDMMGVEDQFGLSGAPWELLKTFGLTAEHIAKRTKE